MKHILVPTDFSDNARNAISTAVKLFKDTECNFYLLHAHGPSVFNVLRDKRQQRSRAIYDSSAQRSNQGSSKIPSYLEEHHSNPKHTFKTISKSDVLLSAIKETLKEKDIELIVMGTKGATGAKNIFLGSNTVKVIKNIRECPIIAVPHHYDFQGLRKLVFPTDFTRPCSSRALHTLVELVSLWKTKINIFFLSQQFSYDDERKANKKILKECFQGLECAFYKGVIDSKVAVAINEFALECKADMVALVHYPSTYLEKITEEPIVKKVGFHTKVPLLILPELDLSV